MRSKEIPKPDRPEQVTRLATYHVYTYENVIFRCRYETEAASPKEARDKVELGDAEFLDRKEITGEVFDIPLDKIKEVSRETGGAGAGVRLPQGAGEDQYILETRTKA